MIRFRTLLCAASAACGITLGFGAQAQTNLIISLPSSVTCSGSFPNITCTDSGGGPVTPVCSITGGAAGGTLGTPLNLNGSCGSATPLAWGGCTSANGSTCTLNPPAIGPITVTLNAPGATGASKTITFNDASSGGDGGGTIPATCPDGSKTIKAADINVFDGFQVGTFNFNGNQTAYYVITVPQLPANTQMQFAWYQYGIAVTQQVYVSKTDVCSTATSATAGTSSNGTIAGAVSDGQSGITGSGASVKMHMQPGETWYISVKNLRGATSNSCKSGPCSTFIKPQILR